MSTNPLQQIVEIDWLPLTHSRFGLGIYATKFFFHDETTQEQLTRDWSIRWCSLIAWQIFITLVKIKLSICLQPVFVKRSRDWFRLIFQKG